MSKDEETPVKDWPLVRIHPNNHRRIKALGKQQARKVTDMTNKLLQELLDKIDNLKK